MVPERYGYKAYLLRLWRVRTESKLVWRASLEDPHTGERTGFASLDGLFSFLQKQTKLVSDPADDYGERGGGSATTATPQ
jgi:hypothetical protein